MQARAQPLYRNAPFYFLLLLVIAFIGFFPSYYARLGKASFTHHFHGILATLWMLLLIGQAWLMRQRALKLHRAIGKASIFLVVLFAVSGLMIVHDMLTRTGGFAMAFGARLAFLDTVAVLYFVFAYAMAIRHRRDVHLHARYMASTAILLLPPAAGRIIGGMILPPPPSFPVAFHLSFILAELVVLALILHDRSTGKVRAPYLILLAVTLVQHASFEIMHRLGPWQALIASIRGA